jgi:hypothetical protein
MIDYVRDKLQFARIQLTFKIEACGDYMYDPDNSYGIKEERLK